MFKVIKRWWKYMTAKLSGSFNERADPKVQLEQAIMEAQEQHRRLREQAANVIANQKQTEMRLNRAMEELEKQSPGAIALFVQGAGADANPLPRRTVELAIRHGQTLAAAVVEVMQGKMKPVKSVEEL